LTAGAATCLDRPDNAVRLDVTWHDLTEHDVLSVEPRSDNGGDEELRSVAKTISYRMLTATWNSRVGAGIGHGEEEWLGVLFLEVLVGKLLAVDGATSGSLMNQSAMESLKPRGSHVATSKVTTLKHKVGDHTVKDGSRIVFSFWTTLANCGEVLGSLWDDVIKDLEVDASGLSWNKSACESKVGLVSSQDLKPEYIQPPDHVTWWRGE
jgi:hypothetical protein